MHLEVTANSFWQSSQLTRCPFVGPLVENSIMEQWASSNRQVLILLGRKITTDSVFRVFVCIVCLP